MYKILVFDRGFPQIPIARSGILKNPSGSTPCPRGFSKSPPGSGDLDENPLTKTRIFYINFLWAIGIFLFLKVFMRFDLSLF